MPTMTARLAMEWEALRRLGEEAGDIGPYPATDARLLRLEEGSQRGPASLDGV